MIHKLADARAALGSDGVKDTKRQNDENGIFQIEITGTATAVLQGRCAPDAPWVDLKTYTASGSDVVAVFPEMRANVSAFTSGVVNAWLAE